MLAWLRVSKDPVNETNETCGSNFWKRTREYYNANKNFVSDCFERSLIHSWLTILEEVNKLSVGNKVDILFRTKLLFCHFFVFINVLICSDNYNVNYINSHMCIYVDAIASSNKYLWTKTKTTTRSK